VTRSIKTLSGWVRRLMTLGLAATLLAACAGPVERADDFIAQDEWMKAVLEYRKAVSKDRSEIEYRSRLRQTEQKAADFYYQRGLEQLGQDNVDGAIVQFQQGLTAMPDHGKLSQVMNQALLRKEAQSLYEEALREMEAGKPEEAKRLLRRALEAYSEHKRAAELLARNEKETLDEEAADRLVLTSRAPVTLNFRQTDLRAAFEFVAKSFGVDIIFDEGVKSVPITLFAKDVTFEQAISLMLTTTKTFYKKVGPNTILLAPDSKEKRGQYEDQVIRTFQLSSIRAKEMADILKGLITVRKLIVNEPLNSLVLRDTDEVIKLAGKIIEANDRRLAELILEVEILEVNRSKAERLGLDLGSYRVSASTGSTVIRATGDVGQSIRNALTLTLPSATFNFYKQDVDAKTLANPKVRVLSGKNAKIHIGDRVPLRAATIQDVTGQVRTTYDYKEIGIRLLAEPIVHIDNSVTVKVGLEVSTLGENLGTQNEPAFRIGTRNAETFMTLRDGETAILGGLIRDEERRTRVRVPLLGDIPAAGALFTSFDDSSGRTDVLLTITPRVVRGWDLPTKEMRSFVSGTEDRYLSEPLFAGLRLPAVRPAAAATAPGQPAPVPSLLSPSPPAPPTPVAVTAPVVNAAPDAAPAPAVVRSPVLAFSEAVYESSSNTEFTVQLVGESLREIVNLPMEILLNPQLLKLVRFEAGSAVASLKVEMDESLGVLRVIAKLKEGGGTEEKMVLARLVLRGDKPGISYLVYRAPSLEGANGTAVSAQVRASRVVIK
jgi:general secretion pathway protein D